MRKIVEGLVSVVVPVYNGEKYIKRCIESIKNQSYSNIEVFVIDDGSTDDTSIYAAEAIGDDYRFDIINVDNGGVSEARNLGITMANGEWITFADIDDVLEKEHIENLVKMVDNNNSDIGVVAYSRFSDDDILKQCKYEYKNKKKSSKDIYLLDKNDAIMEIMKDAKYAGYVWNKIFRLSLIDANKIKFDTELHMCEDLYFCVQAMLSTDKKISFSEEKTYYYYDNLDGITKGRFSEKLFTQIDAWYAIKDLVSFDEKLLSECRRNLVLVAISQTSRMIRDDYMDIRIQSKLKDVVRENYNELLKDGINPRDRKLGGLIFRLPVPIYRLVYKYYDSRKKKKQKNNN